MPIFCFEFCQAVKLRGLCRIKIILSYKYRHLILKLKVIYFVFPSTQYVVYNYARIKKLIHKWYSCQVLRKVKAQIKLTVGLNHVQTDLPWVCFSISSPRAAAEACLRSWAKHPEDEPAPSPGAAQPGSQVWAGHLKLTLGTSERVWEADPWGVRTCWCFHFRVKMAALFPKANAIKCTEMLLLAQIPYPETWTPVLVFPSRIKYSLQRDTLPIPQLLGNASSAVPGAAFPQ